MRRNTRTIWNQQLPSLIGIFSFFIAIVTILWLSRNVIYFGSKAAAGSVPKDVQISNITDISFTVSYTTDDKVLGTVAYGKGSQFDNVALDERDKITNTPTPHYVHYFTIQNLLPGASYAFEINSNNGKYLNNNQPYQITTAITIANKPTIQPPITGTVTLDDGSIPNEAIVYVSTAPSQLLSGLIKQDGSYLIPLNMLRTTDLSNLYILTPTATLSMNIVSSTSKSHISVLPNQTNPVPIVVLSKDYDFSIGNLPITAAPANIASYPVMHDTSIVKEPVILSPKSAQGFKDQQPMFSGKAIPNSDVEITIQSKSEVHVMVKSDTYGNWSFRPGQPLEPGQHTITVKTVDVSGVMKSLMQQFTVYASGSLFTQSVTGTPTMTPTITPTGFPTLTPTIALQPSPVGTPSASITPTIITLTPTIVTPAPTIMITSSPSVKPPIPKTGSSAVVLSAVITGLSILAGLLVFVFSHGSAKL